MFRALIEAYIRAPVLTDHNFRRLKILNLTVFFSKSVFTVPFTVSFLMFSTIKITNA